MKHLFSILFLVLFAIATTTIQAQDNKKTTTYYFIRHAEKDRSDATNRNPNLTEKGQERAKKWSQVLKNVRFNAVYSTNYNRTQQTAAPTAKQQGLTVQLYNPRELYSTDFHKATYGKTVLVVGHSNTTPAFVNKVLNSNKYKDIDDNNNANLYIVTINPNGAITDTLLYIN